MDQDVEECEENPQIVGDKICIDKVHLWEVENLSKKFQAEVPANYINTMGGMDHFPSKATKELSSSKLLQVITKNTFLANNSIVDDTETDSYMSGTSENSYNEVIGQNECILADLVRSNETDNSARAYVRAGPRQKLHFYPKTLNAAIVTCGGLCPGLNNCIRELTNTLIKMYGVRGKIYGIRGGYKGFYDDELPPIELTVEVVREIHHKGGTILGSSRGGFNLDKIIAFIKKKNIKQLYIIGGDGTQRGSFEIHEECMKLVSTRRVLDVTCVVHL
jgi:hypothetical protein